MLDLGRSAALQRFYGFKWALIGNLGVDVLMLAVGPVLGVERGAWAVAALTPALMVLGMYAVGRAAHRRVQPTSFLALPFVYASPFEWGFLNYDLAVALSLLAFALWIGWHQRSRSRAMVFVPLAFGLWVCHAAGWGLLGLLAAGYELQAAVHLDGWRLRAAGQAALRTLPLTPPALLSVGILAPGGPAQLYHFSASPAGVVLYKLIVVFGQLHDRVAAVDAGSIPLILGLLAFSLYRGASISNALAFPAAMVGIASILMPPVAAGIALADYRLAPVAVIVFILAIRADTVGKGKLVAAALCLTGLRLAVTTYGWHEDAAAYQRHLTALNSVPMGARILVLVPDEGLADLVDYGRRPMGHLGDLAIARRDALVNSEWVIGDANLLEVKGNADIAYHADPSQLVPPAEVGRVLASAPLDHFDYVWVLGRYPDGPAPGHLKQVYADEETRLFRIAM